MRRATRRFGFSFSDPIGEYKLSNGRTVRIIWLTIEKYRCNIVAWEVGDSPVPMKTVENVGRLQASALSEQLLDEFENLP